MFDSLLSISGPILFYGGLGVAFLLALGYGRSSRYADKDELERWKPEALDSANEDYAKGVCPSCSRVVSFHCTEAVHGKAVMHCAHCGDGWDVARDRIVGFRGVVNAASREHFLRKQVQDKPLRRAA